MSFTQALYIAFLMVVNTFAKGYGGGYRGGYGANYGAGHGNDYEGGYGAGPEKFAPKPYYFGYVADGIDGSHFRKEKGDSSGNVQGSYGYSDKQGLYRKVEYVANAGGFRASVKTNEPGTDGKIDPADVQMHVETPPAGIQDKYSVGPAPRGFAGVALSKGHRTGGVPQFAVSGMSNGYGSEGVPHFGTVALFAEIPRSSSGKSIH